MRDFTSKTNTLSYAKEPHINETKYYVTASLTAQINAEISTYINLTRVHACHARSSFPSFVRSLETSTVHFEFENLFLINSPIHIRVLQNSYDSNIEKKFKELTSSTLYYNKLAVVTIVFSSFAIW